MLRSVTPPPFYPILSIKTDLIKSRVGQVRSEINKLVSQDHCDVLALLAYDLLDCDLFIFSANKI